MWAEVRLVAAKDLKVEVRSRVAMSQVVPFALIVIVLFAFAFDADHQVLRQASAGLFWVAVLFSSLLIVQRSVAIEQADGGRDGIRLSGLSPAAVFLGKAAAVFVELIVLEIVLGVGVAVLYGTTVRGALVLAGTCLVATGGIATAGTIYGGLASGIKWRETLLPLLALPVLAPVVLAATQADQAALDGRPGDGASWLRLLAVFALVYLTCGVLAYNSVLEES